MRLVVWSSLGGKSVTWKPIEQRRPYFCWLINPYAFSEKFHKLSQDQGRNPFSKATLEQDCLGQPVLLNGEDFISRHGFTLTFCEPLQPWRLRCLFPWFKSSWYQRVLCGHQEICDENWGLIWGDVQRCCDFPFPHWVSQKFWFPGTLLLSWGW